jgi:predicted O-methyltransferase YrrM
MMDDNGKAIATYIQRLFAHEDDALRQAREEARTAGLPGIEVPTELGTLLGILARAVGARKILEIGTLGGYSGTWLARALVPGGKLITLEVDPHHAEVARRNFERAGVADRVTIRLGPALETLPDLQSEAPFDLIFIDADKDNYPSYLDWALALSRPGALIVADNVLQGGRVLANPPPDDAAAGIQEFNRRAAEHPRLDALILPARGGGDGILVAVVRDDR